MIKKYHISKETGLPNICRAKTPESCRAQPAFGEKDIPHFDNKSDAQKYIEEQLAKQHEELSSNSKKDRKDENEKIVKKDLETIHQALTYVEELVKEQEFQFEGVIENIDDFFDDHLPGFTKVKELSQVGYTNEYLMEKNNNFYLVRTYGGDYIKHKILSADMVYQKTAPQIDVALNNVEEIDDEEIMSSIMELHKTYDGFNIIDDKNERTIYFNGSRIVLERDDQSKVYGFPLYAEGDQSMLDSPEIVNVHVEMYESDERQNARVMDKGYVVYDTGTGKGIVTTYRDASEDGGGDYFFILDENTISKSPSDPGYQNIYSISGTGKIIDTSYYSFVK